MGVLRFFYHLNILVVVVLITLCSLKAEELVLQETTWDSIIAPLYFFMTELLLISIIAFVVLVNTFIHVCCSGGKS